MSYVNQANISTLECLLFEENFKTTFSKDRNYIHFLSQDFLSEIYFENEAAVFIFPGVNQTSIHWIVSNEPQLVVVSEVGNLRIKLKLFQDLKLMQN